MDSQEILNFQTQSPYFLRLLPQLKRKRVALKKIEIVLRQTEQDKISETVLATFDHPKDPLAAQSDLNCMRFPGLTISLSEQIVYRNNEPIILTNKEFCILVFLAQHPKWVYSAEQIYAAVWRESDGQCGNAVSKIISQLRRKLTPDTPYGGYIHTISGRGYKFESPE